ncbi:MAG: prepilin-type N-terminal cleavage/methylation domain-containing protein [Thermoguttaceae bacterium]|nr:prepilin-type N-terminal cleavage/methylation domain-containing protein [Thermoguttaceae bacterium]
MNTGKKRPAFTLVELMIVIVIIAILAGLTTVGTRIAIRRSKEATVTLALEQLSMAIEKYKNDIGEYPPDFTDLNAVTRHVRKRWPRCDYADNFVSLAVENDVFGWDVSTCGPASALVFWLGGIPDANGKPGGFFLSPTDPLCINPGTSTQREEPRYSFPDGTVVYGSYDFDQMLKLDAGIETVTCGNGPAFQPGKDDSKPVVYFCASAPAENDLGDGDETENGAYQMIVSEREKYCAFKRIGCATPYAKNVETTDADYWTWHEPERFQLIHPGQDGLFSDNDTGAPVYPYPCTAFGKTESSDNTLTSADDDNIVNFAEGGTLESLYPEK